MDFQIDRRMDKKTNRIDRWTDRYTFREWIAIERVNMLMLTVDIN